MNDHFTKSRALHLIDTIRQYWRGYGKMPKLEAINDPLAGWVVRSNMLCGKPVGEERPIYKPARNVKLNKRIK